MRPPNRAEIAAIRFALADETYGELVWEPNWDNVAIIENYTPDGPGWSGKLAIFPCGEASIVTTCEFLSSADVVKSIKTMDYSA